MKTKKLLLIVMSLLMFAVVFSTCYGAKKRVIGFSPTTLNNPFWHVIQVEVEKVIKAHGDSIVTTDPQNDQSKQNDQIGDLVSQRVDALLIAPCDSAGVKPALLLCKEKNIPVINFDTPVKDTDLVSTIIASDNYNAGVVVAKDMMARLKNGSKIAILHSPMGQACIDRVQGFKDTIKDYFKVVSISDGKGDTGVSLPIAEDVLQSTPDLAAFFAVNDPSAFGCVQALAAHKLTGKVLVYGVDGNPQAKVDIANGTMAATGAQSPKTIGQKSIEAAYKLMNGQSVDPRIKIPTFLINKQNVKKYGTTSWQ